MRRLFALVFAVGALATPASANAHIGGEALIVVPLDHIDPGQTFPVIASDLGADSSISFRLVAGNRSVELGTAVAGPDGHFTSSFTLPADFPHGYAELIASADDGSSTSTFVLVGPRTDATPAGPDQLAWWQDPAVLLLSGALLCGGLLLAVMTLRSSRRERAAVAVATASGRRKVVRRKSRRR